MNPVHISEIIILSDKRNQAYEKRIGKKTDMCNIVKSEVNALNLL